MDDEEAPRCLVCGETGTYVEDGVTYCLRGHDQQRGLAIGEDWEDRMALGRKVRGIQEKGPKVKVQKVLRGKKAFELYLQAYGFIIQQQCNALITEKKLTEELWTIARSLWALRLSKLVGQLEDPVLSLNSQTDVDPMQVHEPTTDTRQATENEPALTTRKLAWKEQRRTLSAFPKLIESIGLCYLGVLLLRLDVSLGDFNRWIRNGEIVYHRAVRFLPVDMREKMPGEHQEALDTPTLLQQDQLHATVARLAPLYSVEFGMSFPKLNSPLFVIKYIMRLALPIELFPACQKLNKITNFSFSYPSKWMKRQRLIFSYPEVQLMSILVIAVKSLYPFNIAAQHTISPEEPARLAIDWTKWSQIHRPSMDPKSAPKRASNFETTEDDILKMTGDEIDKYMDWYQRQWPQTDRQAEGASKEILDLFPLHDLPPEPPRLDSESKFEEEVMAKLKLSQSQLVLKEADPSKEGEGGDDGAQHPEMQYQIWHKEEDVSVTARIFLDVAADVIGVSWKMLFLGVAQTERIIQKWRLEQRRREQYPEEYQDGLGLDDDSEEAMDLD